MGRISEKGWCRGNPEICKRRMVDISEWKCSVVYRTFQQLTDDNSHSLLPSCLPAGFVARGDDPRPCPAPRSAPVWAGIVSGWRCSSGSSGLVGEAATPWSCLSQSSQFCGSWNDTVSVFTAELKAQASTGCWTRLPWSSAAAALSERRYTNSSGWKMIGKTKSCLSLCFEFWLWKFYIQNNIHNNV